MIQLLKMAIRDLGRNKRRSILSALALAMGLSLLLLMASVVEGEMRDALNMSIKMQSGHIQLRSKTYDEAKTSLAWEDLVENPDTIAAQVASLAPVKFATPRLFISGIVSTGNQTLGVNVIGVDPASGANAPYHEGMVSGDWLLADDREGIVIGKSLADKVKLNTGDNVNLLVNTADGTVNEQTFTIRGLYATGTPGIDRYVVLMPLNKAQAITAAQNHASTIFVMLKDREQTAAVVDALKNNPYQVKTWQEMNAMMVEFEKFSGAYMMLLYLIVLAITATVIVNTLVMSVHERTREIGILAAIGMKSSRIMAMFLAESTVLTLGGIVAGLALGGVFCAYAARYGFYIGNMGVTGILIGERIYGYLTFENAVNLSITALIVSLLAALYPAMMAARMEPVEALHGGK